MASSSQKHTLFGGTRYVMVTALPIKTPNTEIKGALFLTYFAERGWRPIGQQVMTVYEGASHR